MDKKDWIKLILSVIICQMAGFIGAIFTTSSVKTWYVTLVKPEFNPPSWVFGPVWSALYLMMGISLFIVWKKAYAGKKITAVSIFAVQLVLNSLWSFLFFGLNEIQLALAEIIVLWLFILASIILFYPISRTASLMLIPYLLWVSFAAVLNYEIMRLNI